MAKFQGFKGIETVKRKNFEACRGAVAQLGERLVCNQEATGSIPVSSTRISIMRAISMNGFGWRSAFSAAIQGSARGQALVPEVKR